MPKIYANGVLISKTHVPKELQAARAIIVGAAMKDKPVNKSRLEAVVRDDIDLALDGAIQLAKSWGVKVVV